MQPWNLIKMVIDGLLLKLAPAAIDIQSNVCCSLYNRDLKETELLHKRQSLLSCGYEGF